jgi:hypothetical protein
MVPDIVFSPQPRIDTVFVPEPPQSEIPRKAKVAKEWK